MRVKSKALVLFFGVYLLTGCSASKPDVDQDINSAQTDITAESTFELAESPEPDLIEENEELLAEQEIEVELHEEGGVEIAQSEEKSSLLSVQLSKSENDSGLVRLSLTDEVPFALRQTAPNEYTLELPTTELATTATMPQIGAQGTPGIRSARASSGAMGAQVRMFVDEGVTLAAISDGNSIIIEPQQSELPVTARAQLADGEQDDQVGILSADGAKRYTGRLISLDLQDTDIDNALRIIAEVSNLNIIASDDVRGKVTLRLVDVPWDQALDVILKTNGLGQEAEGSVIRIAPVDQLRQEREARLEAKRAQENLEDLTVRYTRISYARAADLIEAIESVLSERGSVSFDERTNQIIIKDIQKGHEQAAGLISKLDLRTPQILLETQIVEANTNLLRDLGFQWNYQYTRAPAFGNATGDNFPNTVGIGSQTVAEAIGGSGNSLGTPAGNIVDFPAALAAGAASAIGLDFGSADGSRALSARLSALEQEGDLKVISRPQVATVNNKQAEIQSVTVFRVRTNDSGVSVATGSGASSSGGGATAFEEIEVGIELRVTPQASPDYYVLLDVEAESSIADFGQAVDDIPATVERTANSTILVKSGQTFALGGVYRTEDNQSVDGVPFLKDIPFFGHAFRSTFTNVSNEELIFFITPHIIEGSFDPASFQ